jgi:hypothetical protein
MGRFEEAVRSSSARSEQDPLSPTAWTGLAGLRACHRPLRPGGGSDARILELSPDRAVARHMLAYSLALQGRHDEARREAEPRAPGMGAPHGPRVDRLQGGPRGRRRPFARTADRDRQGDDCAFQVGALYAQRGQAATRVPLARPRPRRPATRESCSRASRTFVPGRSTATHAGRSSCGRSDSTCSRVTSTRSTPRGAGFRLPCPGRRAL